LPRGELDDRVQEVGMIWHPLENNQMFSPLLSNEINQPTLPLEKKGMLGAKLYPSKSSDLISSLVPPNLYSSPKKNIVFGFWCNVQVGVAYYWEKGDFFNGLSDIRDKL
jgi:hypothetical protein